MLSSTPEVRHRQRLNSESHNSQGGLHCSISVPLGKVPDPSCIFLGMALRSKNQPKSHSCNLFVFVLPLPPCILLPSQPSSRCGFRTEGPSSAGTKEPCWPIKTLPSSSPTQEMWPRWSSLSYLALLLDPPIISPGGQPPRTGEWLAHSPLLQFHMFLSHPPLSRLPWQPADIP